MLPGSVILGCDESYEAFASCPGHGVFLQNEVMTILKKAAISGAGAVIQVVAQNLSEEEEVLRVGGCKTHPLP